jgi:hypothetical protein
MIPNYDSYYKKYANQTLSWLSSDKEQLYKHNLIRRRAELERYNWIDSEITYRFNSFGFRCDEFTEVPTAMFLGCSLTIGLGLPLNAVWPELVSSSMNLKCANLGVASGAPDTAFRFCHGYIDRIKPKIVIYMTPPSGRFEISDGSPKLCGPSNFGHFIDPGIYKVWAGCDDNLFFNEEKNLLGIKMLCTERNIKFINVNSSELRTNESLARDLAHPGIECNHIFAHKLLNTIN